MLKLYNFHITLTLKTVLKVTYVRLKVVLGFVQQKNEEKSLNSSLRFYNTPIALM